MKRIWINSIWVLLLLSLSSHVFADEKFRIWDVSYKSQKEILTFKDVSFPNDIVTPQSVLDYLFRKEKQYDVKVVLVKNDVAIVNIEGHSDYITNQSGATGAFHFAAKTVFNLTEFDNIGYVYFVDEGDHFLMGKYERLDYWDLMTDYRKNSNKKELESRLNAKDNKVYSFVEMLAEIGDKESIGELENLKVQCKEISNCCDNVAIDDAIKKIRSKLLEN